MLETEKVSSHGSYSDSHDLISTVFTTCGHKVGVKCCTVFSFHKKLTSTCSGYVQKQIISCYIILRFQVSASKVLVMSCLSDIITFKYNHGSKVVSVWLSINNIKGKLLLQNLNENTILLLKCLVCFGIWIRIFSEYGFSLC